MKLCILTVMVETQTQTCDKVLIKLIESCRSKCKHRHVSTTWGSLHEMGELYQCQFPSWDIVVLLCWRRQWHPTPVLLPRKSHGRRSLLGCSPWGRSESDTTERLHFHFLLSCIGEGNGNPLQCYCLENPRDGGAWWAAVCGVAQSQTRLRRLSSSSSSSSIAL